MLAPNDAQLISGSGHPAANRGNYSSRVDQGTWVLAGTFSGAALGLFAVIGPVLVLHWKVIVYPLSWPFLVVVSLVSASLFSLCGLIVGLAFVVADGGRKVTFATRFLAACVASLALSCLFAAFKQSSMGLMVGLVIASSAGLCATAPDLSWLERGLPLRGRWLRMGLAGLLLAGAPLLYLALARSSPELLYG